MIKVIDNETVTYTKEGVIVNCTCHDFFKRKKCKHKFALEFELKGFDKHFPHLHDNPNLPSFIKEIPKFKVRAKEVFKLEVDCYDQNFLGIKDVCGEMPC